MDEDDIVETSDAEELSEIRNERISRVSNSLFGSSPRRASSPADEDVPRKRLKLTHEHEDDLNTSIHPNYHRNRSPTQMRSSSTAAGAYSPRISSLFVPSRSPTRTPGRTSLTKVDTSDGVPTERIAAPFYTEIQSQEDDPLLLQSPGLSQMPSRTSLTASGRQQDNTSDNHVASDDDVSSEGAPLPEAQILPSLFSDVEDSMALDIDNEVQATSDIDGHIIEDPSTTPPVTPHSLPGSPWRSPRSSPDPLALNGKSLEIQSQKQASSVDTGNHNTSSVPLSRGLDSSDQVPQEGEASPRVDMQKEEIDPLLMFSPAKPALDDQDLNTPGSPVSEGDSSPIRAAKKTLPREGSPTDSDRPALVPRLPIPAPPADMPSEETNDRGVLKGKYSLRARAAAQKNPYTTERIMYAAQMKHNPEAYVGRKEIQREMELANSRVAAEDRYVDEEEEDMEQLIERVERERARRRELRAQKEREKAAASGRDLSHYPAILQEELSTDEEEKKMDEEVKRAKKILKAKETERKEREKEERRRKKQEEEEEAERTRRDKGKEKAKSHRPKLHPMDKPMSKRQGSTNPSIGGPTSRHTEPMASRSPSPPFPTFGPVRDRNHSSQSSGKPVEEVDVLQDYFNQDDFEMYGSDDPPQPDLDEPGPSDYATRKRTSRSPPPSSSMQPPPLPDYIDEDEVEHESNQDLGLDKRQLKALRRMMPVSLINKKMGLGDGRPQSRELKKRVSSPAIGSGEEDEDASLRPGQTRVRKPAIVSVREVKGDSESEREILSSSDEDDTSVSDAGSEAIQILQLYKPPPLRASALPKNEHERDIQPEIISVHSSSSEGEDDFRYFVEDAPSKARRKGRNNTKRLRDQNLIDYMLQKDRASGVGGRRKLGKRRHTESGGSGVGRSGYKYDIMARDSRKQGRERQSMLSFDGHTSNKRRHRSSSQRVEPMPSSGSRNSGRAMARSESRSSIASLFNSGPQHQMAEDYQEHSTTDAAHQPKHPNSWKEQRRRRKDRAKQNGVYTLANGVTNGAGGDSGTIRNRVTSTRRNDGIMTINLEDEPLQRALAGSIAGIVGFGAMRYEPPDPAKQARQMQRVPSKNSAIDPRAGVKKWLDGQKEIQYAPEAPSKTITFSYHLDIQPLASGRTFSATSYIRKGWLHDLLSGGLPPSESSGTPPPSTTFCRLEFSGDMGIERLLLALPRLLNTLYEAATDILEPEPGSLSEEWKSGLRITSQIVTWHFQQASGQERAALQTSLEKEVLRCAAELDKHTTKHIEKPVLALSWFLVELSVRCTPLSTTSASISVTLQTSCKTLLRFLLRLGMDETAKLLRQGEDINESLPSPFHYATELWVCLIHVLLGRMGEGGKPKSDPFWTLLLGSLLPEPNESEPGDIVKTSEDMWLTIFTLCALSQFSPSGVASAKPHLSAFWDLVLHAMKKISLVESVESQNLDDLVLQTRDKYIRILIVRCLHLHDTWRWKLNEGSPLLNKLVEIFRTRNFASLRHESRGREVQLIPRFFKTADWKLLDGYDMEETAFSLFLKLIYRACQDEVDDRGHSAPRLRKWLSLAIPTFVLSCTTEKPSTAKEAVSFFNTLSAIAVAISFDTLGQAERVERAQKYLPFATADPKSRTRIVAGIQRLAILMVKKDFGLAPIFEWVKGVIKTLVLDLKTVDIKNASMVGLEQQAHVKLACQILNCGFEIVNTFMTLNLYPDPQIVETLKPIFEVPLIKHEVLRTPLSVFFNSLFSARAACLPPPQRPYTPMVPQNETEESQDYFAGFVDDIDFSAIEDPVEEATSTPVVQEKDAAMRQVFQSQNRLMWQIYPHVKAYIQSPPASHASSKDYSNECDMWLRIWLCLGDLTRPPNNKWGPHLDLLHNLIPQVDDDYRWAFRVRLSIMFQLLQIDPMAYMEHMKAALDVFFQALVSDAITLESRYVSLLLSIDCLRHPIFAGVSACLPPREGDYHFSVDQLKQLKVPLLRVIFTNLEHSISSERAATHPTINPVTNLPKGAGLDHCQAMFGWMRETRNRLHRQFGDDSERVRVYTQFCCEVLDAFQRHPLLESHPSFDFYIQWRKTLSTHT